MSHQFKHNPSRDTTPSSNIQMFVISIILKFILARPCCTDMRASTRENLILLHANNKGADQPAHPRKLISAFDIRFMES